MSLTTPRELFLHELSDTLSAEQIFHKVLGEMAQETKLPDARTAFESHQKETAQHIENVKTVFKNMGEQPEKLLCHAADGLKKEHDSLKEEKPKGDVLELGLLGGAGKTEHYEIASYKMLVQMAKDLGEADSVKLLQQNLDQEIAAANKVEKLARTVSKGASQMATATR